MELGENLGENEGIRLNSTFSDTFPAFNQRINVRVCLCLCVCVHTLVSQGLSGVYTLSVTWLVLYFCIKFSFIVQSSI